MIQEIIESVLEQHQSPHDFLQNHYVKGFYGWVFYNAFMMWYEQKKYDIDNNGYGWSEFLSWLKFNNLSLIVSGMAVPLLVSQAPNILMAANEYFDKTMTFSEFYYYCVGLFISGIQFIIYKLKK